MTTEEILKQILDEIQEIKARLGRLEKNKAPFDWPGPVMPYVPKPHPDTYPPFNKSKCGVCGLVFDGPMGYACSRPNCPSGVVYCSGDSK